MKNFQLDQCSNHSGFAEKCNREGRCIVRRLPKNLVDADDNAILSVLLPSDAPILTMDFTIIEDNPGCIPADSAGMIIVKARPNKASVMEKLVAKFKVSFPNWPNEDWSGIYLEIEETNVYVNRLTDRTTIEFGPSFAKRLDDTLDTLRKQ
jgi:hypothetical protein